MTADNPENSCTPKVAAVVLNWNGLEDTLACLDSLAQIDVGGASLEIVAVDNGSRISPREEILRRHPQVKVIENPVNLGYAGGNNVGIAHGLETGADFVWLLNNDLVVRADALTELLAVAAQYPRAAALGGKVLRADDPSRVWVAWGEVSWRQSLIRLVGEDAADDGRWDLEREVEWIPGCALLLRADALAEVGLLEEDYFAYHEDVEWAARARQAGWSCRYVGASTAVHSVHGSSGGAAHYGGFRKYLSARNSVLYARKYGRRHQRALMAAAIVATLPFQALRRSLSGEAAGVVMKVRGWRDALAGRPIPYEKLGLR